MIHKIMALAATCTLILPAVAMEPAMEDAIRHGAIAKICYRVIDDDGCPVSNAVAHVWFSSYARHQDDADWLVTTDKNGMFTVEHRTNESLDCGFDKEGYYHSSDQILFRDRKDVRVKVKDGKWQPYGETRTVVLKRIKNPYAVKVFSDEQCHRKIPAFEQWLPFDMEQSDWLAPYGKGKCNDVLLRFEKAGSGRVGDFVYSMEACFTNNPHAGFYCKPMDEFSDLKTDYYADTNASYCANYRFLIDAISKGPVKIMGLEKGSCLVFRTRTRVDENGKLIGAHYGKYCGSWRSDRKELHFGGGCFNPVENDNNIEGDQTLFYKLKNNKR